MKRKLTARSSWSLFGKILLFLVSFSFIFAGAANATFLLNLGPDIPGGSTDRDHPGWIVLNTLDWGISLTNITNTGGGSSAGKVKFKDLTITKHIDKSSTKLTEYAIDGKTVPNAEVDFTTSGAHPLTYFKMELKDATISSYDLSGKSSDASDSVTETISFNYSKIELVYNQYDEKGTLTGIFTTGPLDAEASPASIASLVNLYALGTSGPPDIAAAPILGSFLLLSSGLIGLIGLRKKLDK